MRSAAFAARLACPRLHASYEGLLVVPVCVHAATRCRWGWVRQARHFAEAQPVAKDESSRGGRYGPQSWTENTVEEPDWEEEEVARGKRKPFRLGMTQRATINRSRLRLGLSPVLNWRLFSSEAVRVLDEWCGLDDPRAQQQLERERRSKVGSSMSNRRNDRELGGRKKPYAHLSQTSPTTRISPGAHPLSRVVGEVQYKDAIALARLVNESNRESVVRGLKACGKPVNGAAGVKYLRRSPVVSVMGHVDHGKTTLLDCLRRSNVAAQEAGGITQSIGAFRVPVPGADLPVTFIDTPGHAAFQSMRKAGVSVTDVVLFVISSVEGVQPQTVEVAKLISEAKVPCVVALTKADRILSTGEDFDDVTVRIGNQLLEHGIALESAGGSVMSVPVCAVQGKEHGIDDLLEALMLQSELLELTTPVPCRAEAHVLEASSRTEESGASGASSQIVQAVVRRGVLKPGMAVIGGQHYTKITKLLDEGGNAISEAHPSQPVGIVGFQAHLPSPNSTIAEAGRRVGQDEWNRFIAHFNHAKSVASEWYDIVSQEQDGFIFEERSDIADEALFASQRRDTTPQLRIIAKAGTRGMVDAMVQAVYRVPKISHVRLRVVHQGVGDVDDNDGQLFSHHPENTLVIGCGVGNVSKHDFGVGGEPVLEKVIYRVEERVKERMLDFVPVIREDSELGKARVLETFRFSGSKVSNVGGLTIDEGEVKTSGWTKVLRNGVEVFRAEDNTCVVSLRHVKEEVSSMKRDQECGIILRDFIFEPGDELVQFQVSERRPSTAQVFGSS